MVRRLTRRYMSSVTVLPLGITTSTLSGGTEPDNQFAPTFHAPLAAVKMYAVGQPSTTAPPPAWYGVELPKGVLERRSRRARTRAMASASVALMKSPTQY